MLALDEGIGNITATLDSRGLLDNTIIAFTTDNGGQNFVGGNNWPLRGNKATVFEGGVRGQGFVWGGKETALGSAFASALSTGNGRASNHLFEGLMHNVDWVPTIYSAAGGNAEQLIRQHKMDGLDIWQALVQTASGGLAAGPRKEVLLHLQVWGMGSS